MNMKMNLKAALLSAFVFPGLGQIYKGCRLKGGIILLLVNILLLTSLAIVIRKVWQLSITEGCPQVADPVKSAEQLLKAAPAVLWMVRGLFCLWLYGVLDALLSKEGKRSE